MDTTRIMDKLATRDNAEPGDYTQDGLLMCGKCQTPKQTRKDIPRPDGSTVPQTLPIICQCEREMRELADKKFRREQ